MNLCIHKKDIDEEDQVDISDLMYAMQEKLDLIDTQKDVKPEDYIQQYLYDGVHYENEMYKWVPDQVAFFLGYREL